jgi:transcriptional regulator with XRE-family HTH domain
MPRRAETDDPLVRALARAVRRTREEQGLTQDALGVRAGIHPTWISHIESGRVNPTFMNFMRISKALGVGPSQLMGRVEEEVQ